MVIYQELINDILQDILDKYVIAYLDDMLIYLNKIFKNYIIKVKEVLKWFNNRRFLFKSEKCKFYQEKIEFLRYIVGKNEIYINPAKIKIILEWPISTNIKKSKKFLKFVNFNW